MWSAWGKEYQQLSSISRLPRIVLLLPFIIALTLSLFLFYASSNSSTEYKNEITMATTIMKSSSQCSSNGGDNYADEFHYMDELALKANTQKASSWHNFTRIYPKYFAAIRNRPLNFLEFGIFKGESVKMWEWYFPSAQLHFADISREQVEYHSSRSRYHFLDQSNEAELLKLAAAHGPFDVIIDDASHQQAHIITTFKVMFPHLRPGGVYVIEDAMTSYVKEYGGQGNNSQPLAGADTAQQLAKDLVDEVNFLAAANPHLTANPSRVPPEIRQRMSYYSKRVDAVHFYTGLIFVLTREEEI